MACQDFKQITTGNGANDDSHHQSFLIELVGKGLKLSLAIWLKTDISSGKRNELVQWNITDTGIGRRRGFPEQLLISFVGGLQFRILFRRLMGG